MNGMLVVMKALDAAARWHVHQRRKGEAKEPYINHPIEVANLVAQATDGADPNLIAAALLHDVIEDCGVSFSLIVDCFGFDVGDLVMEVTDDKTLPATERKRRQVDTAPQKSPRAKLIKLADKTSNLRTIASSPPAGWSPDRRLEYVLFACEVAEGLRGSNTFLEKQFDDAAAAAALSVNRSRDH